MRRKRLTWIVLVAVGLIIPLLCLLYVYSSCTTPGPVAPPPLLQFDAAGAGMSAPGLAFSPDSRWLAFTDGHAVRICDLANDRTAQKLHAFPKDEMSFVVFTHDSKAVLISTWSERLHIVEVPSGELRQSISFDGRKYAGKLAASPISDSVAAIVHYQEAVAPRTSRAETALEVFRLSEPLRRKTLIPSSAYDEVLAFSSDGGILMTLEHDRSKIQLWTMPEGQRSSEVPTYPDTFAAAIDSRAERIASGGRNEQIQLWSVAENRKIDSWSARAIVNALAFHPSGNLVAACNHHKCFHFGLVAATNMGATITVWDQRGSRQNSFRIFDVAAHAIAISPDGKLFAASGADKGRYVVKVWDWDAVDGTKRD